MEKKEQIISSLRDQALAMFPPAPKPEAVPGSVPVVTDEEISELFENSNFGTSGETPDGRRGLMVECVLKHNAHYVDGSTIQRICQAAKLMDGRGNTTWAGSRWAFTQIYQSGKTVVERLKSQDNCTEIQALTQWKREALAVMSQWDEVETYVRAHPSVTLGTSVMAETLRLLKEGDQVTALKEHWQDGRLAGRQEFLSELLRINPEDFDKFTDSRAEGLDGEYSAFWRTEELRKRFNCDEREGEYERIEGLYWDALGNLAEASYLLNDALQALKPFGNYACDLDPGEVCDCHNCRARDVINRSGKGEG